MNERIMKTYDYQRVTVDEELCSQYMDGYEKFGWEIDGNIAEEKNMGKITLHMKRNRNIMNKVELTRLQRHYEACMQEIAALEKSKSSIPAIMSITCGLVGCAFMAGSVFAVTAEQPVIWLMVLLAIPAFLLWGAAWFFNRQIKSWRIKKVDPLIEAKYDEAYEVCEKAYKLL